MDPGFHITLQKPTSDITSALTLYIYGLMDFRPGLSYESETESPQSWLLVYKCQKQILSQVTKVVYHHS